MRMTPTKRERELMLEVSRLRAALMIIEFMGREERTRLAPVTALAEAIQTAREALTDDKKDNHRKETP